MADEGVAGTLARDGTPPEGGVDVLLVEDNRTTAALLERLVSGLGSVEEVEVVHDGAQALDRLRDWGPDDPVDLVLLDLGLPRRTGHEVLRELRDGMDVEALPVVVVSSSGDPADVRRAYEEGANGYMQKPRGVEGLQELEEALESFWLGSAELPPFPGEA